jgi:hypothetical protein
MQEEKLEAMWVGEREEGETEVEVVEKQTALAEKVRQGQEVVKKKESSFLLHQQKELR